MKAIRKERQVGGRWTMRERTRLSQGGLVGSLVLVVSNAVAFWPSAVLLGGQGYGLDVWHPGTAEPWDRGLYSPDPSVSQLDNPVINALVPVLAAETLTRFENTSVLTRMRLRLETQCDHLDLACMEVSQHTIWPILPYQDFTDGIARVNGYGARIGHSFSALNIIKEDVAFNRTVVDSLDVRLDDETILVPVHVVVESLGGDDPYADPTLYQALFDDDFGDPSLTLNVSEPGVGLDQHRFGFIQEPDVRAKHLTDLQGEFPWAFTVRVGFIDEVRPDHIWAQCGIQFRLMSVRVVTVDQPSIPSASQGADVNSGVNSLYSRVVFPSPTDKIDLLAGDPARAGLKVLFMISTGISEGVTVGTSDPLAAVSTSYDRVRQAVVAHELGHSMGIGGPDNGHPENCSDELMCDLNARNLHISGCGEWREGIERRKQYSEICLPGEECLKPTVDIPRNCKP